MKPKKQFTPASVEYTYDDSVTSSQLAEYNARPTIPPAEAEKSPILVPRIATPRNEETEISITLFYLLIH